MLQGYRAPRTSRSRRRRESPSITYFEIPELAPTSNLGSAHPVTRCLQPAGSRSCVRHEAGIVGRRPDAPRSRSAQARALSRKGRRWAQHHRHPRSSPYIYDACCGTKNVGGWTYGRGMQQLFDLAFARLDRAKDNTSPAARQRPQRAQKMLKPPARRREVRRMLVPALVHLSMVSVRTNWLGY